MTANNTSKFVTRNNNTKTVTFTHGVAKNAELEVPTESASIVSITQLIHKSLVKHKLNQGGLISDSVILSSIGTSHFLEGAFLGYEERFKKAGQDQQTIDCLKDRIFSEIPIALALVEYRYGITDPNEQYEKLATLEGLSEETQKFYKLLIDMNETKSKSKPIKDN